MQKISAGWQQLGRRTRILIIGLLAISVLAIALGAGLWVGQATKPAKPAPVAKKVYTTPNPTPTPVDNSFNLSVNPPATPNPAASSNSMPTVSEATRLLGAGDRYRSNGQFTEAAAQYRLILTNYPTSPEKPSAEFGLAVSLADQNDTQNAITALNQFLNDYPNDGRRNVVLFRLGEMYKASQQYADALAMYQQYQDLSETIDGYTNFEIAEVYGGWRKNDLALDFYKKVAEDKNGGSNLLRVTAMERMADVYSLRGDANTAAQWYNSILQLAKISDYRAGIFFKMAETYRKIGDPQAFTVYNVIADQYLTTPSGIKAIKALLTANPNSVDEYYKGYLAWSENRFDDAVASFNKVLGRPDNNTAPGPTSENPARFASAWYYSGYSSEQAGNVDKAVAEYRALADRLPQAPATEYALWRLARLLQKTPGKGAEAITEFARLAKLFPNSQYAENGLYYQFELTLQAGKLVEATKLAREVATKYPASQEADEALYRLANATKDKNLYTEIASGRDDNYFAVRAAEVLSSTNPNSPARSNPQTQPAVYDAARFASETATDREQMEKWLLGWAANVSSTTTMAQGLSNLQQDAGVKRLIELHRLGRSGQVWREAQETFDRLADRPIEMYLLSLTLTEQGEYYTSMQAARRVVTLYQQKNPKVGLLQMPRLLQRLVYPLHYQDLVLEQSRRYELDPLLMLALIRQESAFRADANSGADARGLTQVVPSTGQGIASALDKPGFKADDLFKPATAIEFGAYYLHNQLNNFGGNPYQALAAYNAGAGNIDRWVSANPPDRNFDAFVDGIDFSETRQYVRIVYTNYAMYREIYKGK